MVLNNIRLIDTPIAVGVVGGAIVLEGGTKVIASWAQGNVYSGTDGIAKFTQSNIPGFHKPSGLVDRTGKIFGRTHPQYVEYSVEQFISVRSCGAKGDGVTDDTAAIKSILAKVCFRTIKQVPFTKCLSSTPTIKSYSSTQGHT